jgi:hypothetical protein
MYEIELLDKKKLTNLKFTYNLNIIYIFNVMTDVSESEETCTFINFLNYKFMLYSHVNFNAIVFLRLSGLLDSDISFVNYRRI